ncbi:hypothetical protein [Niallia endozanthoxylica]|uniref:Uncharacterized protein n=1 Tax=Niallia endozanthoxylica TaxID=2036016 RepID=A0A5J5GV00_9BACI|nr:hypothetical protein [Niallia endozanthoxylica]KAA9012101.1 hypothetical protein F4V44_25995 [Niallia endozanthoxylica]
MDPKELERMKEERQRRHEEAQNHSHDSVSVQQVPANAFELAAAMLSPEALGCLVDASLTSDNPNQAAVWSTPLQDFPTEGNSFAVLSNGDATQIAAGLTHLL